MVFAIVRAWCIAPEAEIQAVLRKVVVCQDRLVSVQLSFGSHHVAAVSWIQCWQIQQPLRWSKILQTDLDQRISSRFGIVYTRGRLVLRMNQSIKWMLHPPQVPSEYGVYKLGVIGLDQGAVQWGHMLPFFDQCCNSWCQNKFLVYCLDSSNPAKQWHWLVLFLSCGYLWNLPATEIFHQERWQHRNAINLVISCKVL